MQLQDLYLHFSSLSEEDQRVYVARYRARRDAEFTADKIAYEAKHKRSKRTPAIKLTDEEKSIMKKLGITQAQLRALRALEA